MSTDDFSARLEAALARHIGQPAKVSDLQRLTGGANRTTMSFDADVGGQRRRLIIQLGMETDDPVAGILPEISNEQQARLMIAAERVGAPAPRFIGSIWPPCHSSSGRMPPNTLRRIADSSTITASDCPRSI